MEWERNSLSPSFGGGRNLAAISINKPTCDRNARLLCHHKDTALLPCLQNSGKSRTRLHCTLERSTPPPPRLVLALRGWPRGAGTIGVYVQEGRSLLFPRRFLSRNVLVTRDHSVASNPCITKTLQPSPCPQFQVL